jgi:hypothetical protein
MTPTAEAVVFGLAVQYTASTRADIRYHQRPSTVTTVCYVGCDSDI